MSSVQIVVTCSDRKREQAPSRLRVRALPKHRSVSERAGEWIRRLKIEPAPEMPAERLYVGEHWQAVRDMARTARSVGFVPTLWICSAGYGLISPGAIVKPYSATFSRGHSDSVDRSQDVLSATTGWWQELSHWKGPRFARERSLAAVAESRPRTPLVLVASPSYLNAISADALSAGSVLGDRMFLVSVGSKVPDGLQRFQVPASARLQHRLGGSRVSLNARVAAFALKLAGGSLDRKRLATKLKRTASRMPALPVYDRVKLSDEQVRVWIEEVISQSSSMSASRALRRLRSEGMACEQQRFARLFLEAQGEASGS